MYVASGTSETKMLDQLFVVLIMFGTVWKPIFLDSLR